jgi:hypothetical protein
MKTARSAILSPFSVNRTHPPDGVIAAFEEDGKRTPYETGIGF